jgi:hypothetical protein
MILDADTDRRERHRRQHLESCNSSEVRNAYDRHPASRPDPSDPRYREGWDEDPGYIGG